MNEQANLYDQFADWTDTTAQYPVTAPAGYCSEPSYLALGIADEAGELAVSMPGEDRLKEAGDVLWYASRYATKVLGVKFSNVVKEAEARVEPSRNAIKHAGIICGVEKKRIRDGHQWDGAKEMEKNAAAFEALCSLVSWVIWELAACDFYLDQAINTNMGKLSARLAAGTIHGDGDNR